MNPMPISTSPASLTYALHGYKIVAGAREAEKAFDARNKTQAKQRKGGEERREDEE
jgi:hypothetical protein